MTDFVEFRRTIIELLPKLSAEAVVVLVYLTDRSYIQQGLGVGLSASELARSCGIAYTSVSRVLDELETQGLIDRVYKTKYVNIVVTNLVADGGVVIPFTERNTDETKLAVLEAEVRRLRLQSEKNRPSSGLADLTSGEERDLILEIERRGHGLSHSEANLLGKCVASFGPERTKETYRRMKQQRNPILATYAALSKGIKGKGAPIRESEPFQKVTYRDLDA